MFFEMQRGKDASAPAALTDTDPSSTSASVRGSARGASGNKTEVQGWLKGCGENGIRAQNGPF